MKNIRYGRGKEADGSPKFIANFGIIWLKIKENIANAVAKEIILRECLLGGDKAARCSHNVGGLYGKQILYSV